MSLNPPRSRPEWIALALMLGLAIWIRWPIVSRLPLEFASMRQYHSAMIARAIYFRQTPAAAPDWRRQAAEDYVAQATIPEPTIVEHIAAAGYRVAGGERLWIPQVLSMLCWFMGALFAYGAGRRLSNATGGLATLAVFLFLPFGVGASLSFQPDSLAVMWLSGSLYALVRKPQFPFRPKTTPEVILTAMPAILVRPMTACFLFPAMAAIMWTDGRPSGGSRVRPILALLAISATPAVAYFAYRFFADPTFTARVGSTFVPGLFLQMSFWRGWARFAWLAFGPVLFVVAAAGAVLARGRTRIALISLWAGYVFYGVVFNLHISTHPYYQTLAVPMVALSIGVFASRFERPWRTWTTLVLPVSLATLLTISGLQAGTPPPADADRVQAYEAIGQATAHSRQVIFLADNWGVPLRYHADIGGRYWPTRFEIEMYRPLGASGIPDVAPATRFADLSAQIGGAAYFAVTDLDEFARQPDLRAFLESRFQTVARAPTFLVYRLTADVK